MCMLLKKPGLPDLMPKDEYGNFFGYREAEKLWKNGRHIPGQVLFELSDVAKI